MFSFEMREGRVLMGSCEAIRNAILGHDWIGFDLFDTLLLRPFLTPDDLFCQMEQKLERTGFAAMRTETEQQLRKNRRKELTLQEIYTAIQQKTGEPEATVQQWMQLEMDLELRFCYPRQSGMSLYCAAKEAGKQIAIVTDMYLPMYQIARMLQKIGIEEYDMLLLSSEMGLTKANGGLYRYLKKSGIAPKRFLQIGDNRIADVENPRCLGFDAAWLPSTGFTFRHYGRLYPAILTEQPTLAVRCGIALAVNAYFDDPFRFLRPNCDWNADPYYMGLLLGTATDLPVAVAQNFCFQQGQQKAQQLAQVFFAQSLPVSTAAKQLLCRYLPAQEQRMFGGETMWKTEETCPWKPLPVPRTPRKWKTWLRLQRRV
jgi:FMN phosphatase YigB (HAD superfamily)